MCRSMEGLTRRADFLAAARAFRAGTPSFTLQAREREGGGPPRFGFTCSKKVGNAVRRNRAKRRLREVARLVLVADARDGWDYVLIGRPGATADRGWDELCADARQALARVHA